MQKELKVALVQSHLLWENPPANREMLAQKIAALPQAVDLIVLPEMFTTGFTMDPASIATAEKDKTLAWMQHWANKKDAAIVGSIVNPEGANFYNRLWFVAPNQICSYDKRHTFTLAGEDRVYAAGKTKEIITFRGFKICPLICYDLRFPVWARNVANYDVLLYVANWPKTRINAWDALLKARAIENMSYCIGVNRVGLDGLGHQYVGHSAVYDVLGKTVAFTDQEEVLLATINKNHINTYREKLRFLEDRDIFSLK